jgi:hypothetical protein
MNRLTRALLFSAIACIGLSGCVMALIMSAITTDISREARFQDVIGHELRTRRTLYMYKPEYSSTYPDLRTFYEFHGSKDEGARGSPIIVVPAGHPVKFTKVLSKHGIDGGREDMFGEITLKGTTYPVVVDLNLNDYPNGWRPIFMQSFAVQK